MNRFDRLSKLAQVTVLSFAILLPTLALPTQAAAQTETKLLSEIKNITTISIPNVSEISAYLDNKNVENKSDPLRQLADGGQPVAVGPLPAPVEKAAVIEVKKAQVVNYQYPPKVAPEERVYMHEPEIREYLCPKMGQSQCNIFVAILKAENGTHECTRDNRGLNKNGSLDVGLAQINWNPKYNPPYTVEQLRDCKFNLDIALKKYEARGFQPWYAYTKGAYKKFLKPTPKVEVAVVPVQ